MMKYYTEELRSLQNEIREKERIQAKQKALSVQQSELEKQSEELEKVMLEEKHDVDRLKKGGFPAFFYRATGKMEEKLSKEEGEALAAQMKYEAVRRELQAVCDDLSYYEKREQELSDCKERYEELFERQKRKLKEEQHPRAARIIEIEEELFRIRNQEKEIGEALEAGERALEVSDRILEKFEEAKTWGTVDLIGGGILSDVIKYDKLDQGKEEIGNLQSALRNFRTELADVNTRIDGNLDVEIGDFLHLADYFFDGLFTDWMVYNKIKAAVEKMQRTKCQIETILSKLETVKNDIEITYTKKQNELEHIVVEIQE